MIILAPPLRRPPRPAWRRRRGLWLPTRPRGLRLFAGDVQFVGDQVLFDGTQVAMDSACCCEAPCTCPDDLASAYQVAFTIALHCNGTCSDLLYSCNKSVTVTGTPADCFWSVSTDCNGEPITVLLQLVMGTPPCNWLVDAGGAQATKGSGVTPVGAYASTGCGPAGPWAGCGPFKPPPHSAVLSNVSVS